MAMVSSTTTRRTYQSQEQRQSRGKAKDRRSRGKVRCSAVVSWFCWLLGICLVQYGCEGTGVDGCLAPDGQRQAGAPGPDSEAFGARCQGGLEGPASLRPPSRRLSSFSLATLYTDFYRTAVLIMAALRRRAMEHPEESPEHWVASTWKLFTVLSTILRSNEF